MVWERGSGEWLGGEGEVMKQHLIAFLETRPEDELAKMLNWALVQANRLDDRTPYENRTRETVYAAIFHLEKEVK